MALFAGTLGGNGADAEGVGCGSVSGIVAVSVFHGTVSGASAASSCIVQDVAPCWAREEVRAWPRVCRWVGIGAWFAVAVSMLHNTQQCSCLPNTPSRGAVLCCGGSAHPACPSFSLSTCVVWLIAVRFRSAQTAHMGDVLVNEVEWVKLACELYDIRDDAGKVNSFMVKHVNTKWEV
jgi:hypothetical protein